jgi:hypothetical protein
MKTKIHYIQGANLERIEELASAIEYRTPDWVPYTVTIPGTETSALDEAMTDTLHFSGLLRQLSRAEVIDSGMIEDEDGESHDVLDVLDAAAERLDQAHEEWLEARAKDEALDFLLNVARDFCDQLICGIADDGEDDDSDAAIDVARIEAALAVVEGTEK